MRRIKHLAHQAFLHLRNNIFIIGPLSLIWLIVRSSQKPDRLRYPCQQAAATQGVAFLGVVFHQLGRHPLEGIRRISPARTLILLSCFTLILSLGGQAKAAPLLAEDRLHPAIQAVASSSRVVRVHSSSATSNGIGNNNYFETIDQVVVSQLFDAGLLSLTNQSTANAAWQSILTNYHSGDRIAIKVNNNSVSGGMEGRLINSPQMIIALLSSLQTFGVKQTEIIIYDVSRAAAIEQTGPILAQYPQIQYIQQGNVTWDAQNLNGSFGTVKLPTALTESEHLINLHLMKIHSIASFTGALKNHFGTTSNPGAFHNNIHEVITELNSHPDIKEKTRLVVGEALFATFSPFGKPVTLTNTDIFPEGTPNSIFLSFDPVAMDSVLFDYLYYEKDGKMDVDTFLHVAASAGLGTHEHGTLAEGTYSPQDMVFNSIDYINFDLDQIPPGSVFEDVPVEHPFHTEIELLYQAGYTSGCGENPRIYCPEQTMNRAESAVFLERGIHGTDVFPPEPSSAAFDDLELDSWAAKWADALYSDGFTAGCGENPLIYCPWLGHTRAEGSVFYLRMLHGADYSPPPASGLFTDVPIEEWYAKWAEAAYSAGLIPECNEIPLQFCPQNPLSRGLSAYMMVQAKELK
jgi:hypothetical protein